MAQNTTQDQKLTKNLEKIDHIIFVLSGKGGVGKSTISAYLAVALAQKEKRVGLLDIDIHGPSIPKLLGLEEEKPQLTASGITPIHALPNLLVMSMAFLLQHKDTPVIWRGPMKMGAIQQFLRDVEWGPLDYLIIDLPPGTGDEPLSIAQFIPKATGAIIVTTPQDVALVSVRKSINFVKKMGLPVIGLIENMSGFTCPHCGTHIDLFKKGGGKTAAKEYHIPFLGAIPIDQTIVEQGDAGETIALTKSNTQIKKIFEKIVKNIQPQLTTTKK
jgi:ATP-binding protein involved in chromosome partitioning